AEHEMDRSGEEHTGTPAEIAADPLPEFAAAVQVAIEEAAPVRQPEPEPEPEPVAEAAPIAEQPLVEEPAEIAEDVDPVPTGAAAGQPGSARARQWPRPRTATAPRTDSRSSRPELPSVAVPLEGGQKSIVPIAKAPPGQRGERSRWQDALPGRALV